jgi:predicted transcriptional regulator
MSEIDYREWQKAPVRERTSLTELIMRALKEKPYTSGELAKKLGRAEQPVYNTLQRLMQRDIVARKAMKVEGREVYVYGLLQK